MGVSCWNKKGRIGRTRTIVCFWAELCFVVIMLVVGDDEENMVCGNWGYVGEKIIE